MSELVRSQIGSIGVVLVNCNVWPDTHECLESLSRCRGALHSVVVVDNASSENRIDEFRINHPDVHWIRSETNTGWSGGNNIGIKHFLDPKNATDAIFLLNNDTVVDPRIFEYMQEAFDQGYDLIGPVINDYQQRHEIQTQGVAFNLKNKPMEFFTEIPTPINEKNLEVSVVDIINGCAVAIRRDVFEQIGLIDNRFFLICEESDFCLRAKQFGFACGVLHKSLVWHKHSVTFARAGKPLQRYYSVRNLSLLLSKHQSVPGRKSWLSSRIAYLRHTYHLYCHEVEMANRPGALAVTQGLFDASLGRFGPRKIGESLGGQSVAFIFESMRMVSSKWALFRKTNSTIDGSNPGR